MVSVRVYHSLCLVIICIVCAFGMRTQTRRIKNVSNRDYSEESLLNVTERASRHGYTASEHTVETEDGYVLTLFRVQRAGAGVRGHPVLLVHGLLHSAIMWLDAGPGAGLAYLLADEGHDVWLTNARGSHYSRRHAWLNPNTDSQYWQFCVDEIGRYDLPANIDYVLSQTGALKLNYVGFSQGGGSFFIMCSERPEYRDKINIMIGLAPATRHLFTKSIPFNIFTDYYERNENELDKQGIWEVFPKGGYLQLFLQIMCAYSNEGVKVCEVFKNMLDAANPGSIKKSVFQVASAGFPSGTSVHNMARYSQACKSKNFKKFDYGPDQNMVRYGSVSPPEYNLSAVTVPTVIIYGRNDGIVDPRDLKWLVRRLPNVLESFELRDPHWSHLDFQLSRNIPKLVFPKVKKYLDISDKYLVM